MKQNSRIHQIGAFCLILIFTVQAGLGLWIHSTFHQHVFQQKENAGVQHISKQAQQRTNYSCACSHIFFSSFSIAEPYFLLLPKAVYKSHITARFTARLAYATAYFKSLRAPPVSIS